MKKKALVYLACTAVTAGFLAGCGSSNATSASSAASTEAAETQASTEAATETSAADTAAATESASEEAGPLLTKIQQRGSLIIGTASGYPPYEFVDITDPNQSVIGVDIELGQAIADKLGVSLDVQDMDFSSLLASLPAGTIDMAIAGISPTDERRQSMDFSDNYAVADQKFIILKENADKYKTLDDFDGQPLAAEKSTTQEALCQSLFPDNQLVSLERVPDCILELKSGNVAGVCVESIVGEQYILADDTLAFSDADTGAQKQSAVAMEKGNDDLLAIVNEVIKEHTDNGDVDNWIEEYSQKAADNASE
ncbi:MAG: transporter substrate-binding domain-containing protein [Lachnospiraceae bacterium]